MEKRGEVNILILNKMYYPEIGGVEIVAKIMSETMASFEKVTVLTFNNRRTRETHQINGVEVIRLPIRFMKNSIRLSDYYKNEFTKQSKNADVIVFHFPSGQPELYFNLYKKTKAKKICFYHADVVGYGFIGWFYNNFIVKRFLNVMDEIIVTSPNISKTSKILKRYANKIKVIPLFVDTSHFYPRNPNKRDYLLSFFKVKVNKIVMYVGRLAQYKGLEYLIKAMKSLDNSYGLVLIGEGPKKKRLEKLIGKLGLEDRVLFHKHVSYEELPEFYSSADVFVLPSISRAEAFGLVALEAMACGTPIVTTELGTGTSYYNIHGETGMIVSPKDEKALARSIKEICLSNWKERENLIVERAKKFSIENFTKSIREILRGDS